MAVRCSSGLAADLRCLDALIAREVLRLRARYQLSLDEFRGLYVSDDQVDALLRADGGRDIGLAVDPRLLAGEPGAGHEGSRLADVGEALALDRLDRTLLLVAAAPDIDLKYESLFAYLNDDVTRKWATVDLARRLLGGSDAADVAVRDRLGSEAPLMRLGILRRIEPPAARLSSLNVGFAAAPPVLQALVGLSALSPELAGFVTRRSPATHWDAVPVPPGCLDLLRNIPYLLGIPAAMEHRDRTGSGPTRRAAIGSEQPVLLFAGEAGCGQEEAVDAIATAMRAAVLVCDLAAARSAAPLASLAKQLALEIRLRPALVHLTRADSALDAEDRDVRALVRTLVDAGAAVFLSGRADALWQCSAEGAATLTVPFDAVDFSDRNHLWAHAARAVGVAVSAERRAELAARFHLPPRDIHAAVGAARHLARLDGRPEADASEYLASAARRLVHHTIGSLGARVETSCGWDDLVLPEFTRSRLHELSAAIRCRHRVFDEWGFSNRTTAGVGIRVLFSGPSGTGKTLTAAVIANELGFDLYRIDLSSIVSKYIGETEKNLDRIFKAARGGHLMLFFDEADALFGKRSEVKDAHDRYANIEVAFLLQRLEEHDGVVILASNLKRNVDDAFARRLHFVIEFPPPGQALREQLWRLMFPPAAPLAGDIDFAFLARQFDLAGGDIRNVALDAAFQAADAGGSITMAHVVRALARQLAKEGKSPAPAVFSQYYGLLA